MFAGRMVICNMAVEMGAKTAICNRTRMSLIMCQNVRYALFRVQDWTLALSMAKSHVFDMSRNGTPAGMSRTALIMWIPLAHVTANRGDKAESGIHRKLHRRTWEEDIAVAARIVKGRSHTSVQQAGGGPASSEVVLSCMEKDFYRI